MEEIWKDIKGYEGMYQISNLGRVKSLSRFIKTNEKYRKGFFVQGKILVSRGAGYNNNYEYVQIHKNGKTVNKSVHRMVAEQFIPNPENKKEVNHKDRNPKNNYVGNLEWVTPKENMQHINDNFNFSFGRKPVEMYDLEDNYIRTFNSISDATRFVTDKVDKKTGKPSNANVIRSLKTDGRLTAYGYKFRYKNDSKCND